MITENDAKDYPVSGLDESEVLKNRISYGMNILTPPKRESMWKLYLDKYRDPIVIILLFAAAVSLILAFINQEFIETIGIFIAIFLATTIGFYFERDAAKKFDVLTALGEEQPVKVRRSGEVIEIPRKDIVMGDIVLIEVGDEVPADGYLLTATGLQINESALTGELITAKCGVNDSSLDDAEAAAYSPHLVLRSTMVMEGRGEFVVSAIGDATEIGKVARKTTESTGVQTPLNTQLDKLASLISKVGSVIAFLAFAVFLVHDILTNTTLWHSENYFGMLQVVLNYFMMAVTLIVMAVPEGLPMAVTLALALNMRRMLKSNNLVRKLHACETMGAVNVICTDKTGTLTKNQMTVNDLKLYSGDQLLLAKAIAANTTAELHEGQGIGNPTEAALLLWLEDRGEDYRKLRKTSQIVEQIPFSTEKKYMKTVVSENGHEQILLKGAPEIILAQCDMEDDLRLQIEVQLQIYQQQAMRTLAFSVDGKFQAIAAISDPVRDDVPEAVSHCQQAGIEVKVVTGDTSATALEIGRQIHLFDDVADSEGQLSAEVVERYSITGQEWAELSDDEAALRAKEIRVMSRARPTDKQRLVSLLQQQGAVVAVTGDGTNDAPALHHAHVGLSLGSGTSVAKEASDMTLLDDSFGSIANAVMWGRSLYKNIQRFLFFQLVVNVTALLLVLAGSVVGTEMPLTVTQILWVNLIMDTFAAMALASLPPSREVMDEKPRKTSEFIITPSIGRAILGCGLFFFVLMLVFLIWCERHGAGSIVDIHELTLFFTTFVMLQFWNLFNAKSLGGHHSCFHRLFADKGMLLVLAIILVGQWGIVTFGGQMFRTLPLSWEEWLYIIGATSFVMWGGELYRALVRLKNSK